MRTALSLLGWSLIAGVIAGCATTTPEATTPGAGSGSSGEPAAAPLEQAPPAGALMQPVPEGEESLSEPIDLGADGAARKAVDAESLRDDSRAATPPPFAPSPAAAGAPVTVAAEEAVSLERATASGAGVGAGAGRGEKARRGPGRPTHSVARASGGDAAQLASGVRAGEWDDNANFREFSRYLQKKRAEVNFHPVSLESRRFVVVSDAGGKGVPNCSVQVVDTQGRKVELTTQASGRAVLFPRAEGLRGSQLELRASCQGQQATARADLDKPDGVVKLSLAKQRALPAQRTVDVVFVLDTTGSMSEEISALKGTIREVVASLRRQNARPRLGLVEYKDVTDSYVTRLHQMTTDVDGFTERVASLEASGGGDTPEHVNAGLRVAVDQIRWNPESVARLAFLIGDAPPQLGYQQDVSYASSIKAASHKGIQIFTIAASGMDDLGQVVWRQIAQYTGGTNMFVLRGGAGPQSTGAGDAERSCGGTHKNYSSGNLAELITGKVTGSLRALDSDPLLIAGLGEDENAKPCAERVSLAR
ncbi:MAG TPA: vWA domain-containing protein [Polyangiaceae bacterium]|nr:vWA domain-containing protein [Polyangiaceae bacterium]